MKKERIYEADLLRIICALAIIIYHYACSANAQMPALIRHANGNWGHIPVTMFFLLSGAMLHYNYSEMKSVKQFYFKRWKTIFPVFYILYLFFFFLGVLQYRTLFFYSPYAHPWTLLLSFLGLDGYFSFGMLQVHTYYLIGDWFLGAIILLYAIYPLLAKLMKKFAMVITALSLAGFIAVVLTGWYDSYRQRAFITCLFSFCLGILYMKYRHIFCNLAAAVISSVAGVALCFFTVPVDRIFVQEFMGICFFVAIMYWGKGIGRNKKAMAIAEPVSKLTFPIFLLQHKLILIIFDSFNPESVPKSLALLVITILVILLFSKVTDVLVKAMFESAWFKRLENRFQA